MLHGGRVAKKKGGVVHEVIENYWNESTNSWQQLRGRCEEQDGTRENGRGKRRLVWSNVGYNSVMRGYIAVRWMLGNDVYVVQK